ncbi:Inorganic pyrophosphatase [Yarrowia sp. C11]|nr:Inorganic pyrophosphatase [Yarrowia sp. E02]KAG5371538.1 Inorganic pyrophosphatase [Yarrowia sp. C11]
MLRQVIRPLRGSRVTGRLQSPGTGFFCAQTSSSGFFSSFQVTRAMSYKTRTNGQLYTKEFKLYIENEAGEPISAFHDIPVYPDTGKIRFEQPKSDVVNMVVEVPRWSNAKMEINKSAELNPITQDVKKDRVRFVRNFYPHHGYCHNYGAIPQTWENPHVKDSLTQIEGDNDPIDVVDIGQALGKMGQVKSVKVVGALGLIDEGETDWKIIAIDVRDPRAAKINDIDDVSKSVLNDIHDWFKYYKVPDGKPANNFAFNGKFLNKAEALNVVYEGHVHWLELLKGNVPAGEIDLTNVTLTDTKGFKSRHDVAVSANEVIEPAKVSSSVNDWLVVERE